MIGRRAAAGRGRRVGSGFRHWLLVVLCAGGCAGSIGEPPAIEPVVPGRIAHAGGAVGGATYTNSLEALEHNYARGFRFFEIDLVWSSDGALVALHDWEDNFDRLFGRRLTAPLSAAEFVRADNVRGLTLLSLDGVLSWFASRPDAFLITDVKSRNLDALAVIASRRPPLRGRIIPQIYHPDEYSAVRALGFDAIIWTLYRQRISDFAVVNRLAEMRLFAVAMPKARARRGRLGPYLDDIGVPALAHTVNDPDELIELMRLGVTEVFTDFLPPCEPLSPACAADE